MVRMLKHVLRVLCLLMSAQVFSADYQDENGLVVIEAENLKGATSSWIKETTFTPYTGASYIRWNGSDNFSSPAIGEISATIKINNPGVYRIQMRNKVGHGTNNTEANDTWMKFPGVTQFYGEHNGHKVYPKGSGLTPNPEGASKDGWLKIYCHGTTAWTWRAKTNDGDPYEVYVDFASAGQYKMSISGRSKHHCVDRIVLHKSNITSSYATDMTRSETVVQAEPEMYIYDALSDFSDLTSGEAPFYKDNNFKALAIDPKTYQDKPAKAVATFTGKTGNYKITLKTKAEKDGESTYSIYIGSTKVGTFQNPEVDETGDMSVQTFTLSGVSMTKNTTFTVEAQAHTNGKIAEAGAPNGTAWARGRWTEISFAEEVGGATTTRMAIVADGNSPDPDDLGGTAVTLAIIRAMGAEDRLVYYSHSCDLVRNNTKISSEMEVKRQAMMQTACDGTAEEWGGFDHITFYNCRTQQTMATEKLTAAINASTATSPLAIIEAGEPDVIYDAIAAAESSKLQYVSIITHHPANDDSADDPNKNLSDILADYPAVKEDRITDQNVNLKVALSQWDWAKNHSDERIQWLYAQGKLAEEDPVVNFQHGYFDCSDAGMVYYHLTGERMPTVAMIKSLLTTYVDEGDIVDPSPSDTADMKVIKEKLIFYYPLENNANDASGNAMHATLGDAVSFATGKVGKAASFTNTLGSHLSTPDSVFLYGGESAYTISFWMKLDEVSVREDILQPVGGRTLLYSNGDLSFHTFHQRKKVIFNLTNDESQDWVHITMLIDQRQGKTMHKYYVNGVQRGDVQSGYDLETDKTMNYGRLIFGSSSDEILQRNMTGLIDEIYMFDDVLNDVEIAYIADPNNVIVESDPASLKTSRSQIDAYVNNSHLYINVPHQHNNEVRLYSLAGTLNAHYHFSTMHFNKALELKPGLYVLQVRCGQIIENKKVVVY